MIEVFGVSKHFGEVSALSEVSFSVQKGQIVGFLGSNGAGKTTTMDILCGCIGADLGSAKICGYDITEEPLAAKQRLGYLPDEPPIHNDMTVMDFVHYVGKLRKFKGDELNRRVDDTIERLSLGDMRNRLVGNLSKGYRQRVGLAQALIHNPEVLILDEPTEGLDPKQIAQIRELILSLKGDHTILFSSHILSEVESLCDELIIIDKGKIIEAGTSQEILRKFDTGKTYQLEVRQGATSLAKELSSIEGIRLAKPKGSDETTIEFTADASSQAIDHVARKVLEGQYGLVQLAQKSASLEEIFFKLTR